MPLPRPSPVTEPGQQLQVELQLLDPGLGVPGRARDGDAGVDLCCRNDVLVAPGDRVLVGTGVAVALPRTHVGLVHPRSGLAARTGLTVLNAPGTVDSGYRGEVQVCLVNHDRSTAVQLRRGDRIAQLLVQRVEDVRFAVVATLDETDRGDRGHGSTGGHASLPGGTQGDGTNRDGTGGR